MSKQVRRQSALEINFYRKRQNRVSIVLRRNKVLYRMTTIENAELVLEKLQDFQNDLSKERIIELIGSRDRRWILEAGIVTEAFAMLNLWEQISGKMKLCFSWKGTGKELKESFLFLRS